MIFQDLKIGLAKEFFEQEMPDYVRKSTEEAIEVYKRLGSDNRRNIIP